MLKILGILFAIVVVGIAGILAFAATKPDVFRVQRAASIKAPPEKISAVLSDFRAWDAWSPWEKMDPAMKRTYSGAEKGKGAMYAWTGNRERSGWCTSRWSCTPPRAVTRSIWICSRPCRLTTSSCSRWSRRAMRPT